MPDERDQIAAKLRHWADETPVNLVLTTGGTGMTTPRRDAGGHARACSTVRRPDSPRRCAPGRSQKTPHAMLSRAVSGIRGSTLIINMPGSPRACREQFAMIREALPHGVEKLLDVGGDCARSRRPPADPASPSGRRRPLPQPPNRCRRW